MPSAFSARQPKPLTSTPKGEKGKRGKKNYTPIPRLYLILVFIHASIYPTNHPSIHLLTLRRFRRVKKKKEEEEEEDEVVLEKERGLISRSLL